MTPPWTQLNSQALEKPIVPSKLIRVQFGASSSPLDKENKTVYYLSKAH